MESLQSALKRASALLSEARSIVEQAHSDVTEDFEERCEESDKFVDSDKGLEMDAQIADLEELGNQIDSCENILDPFTK